MAAADREKVITRVQLMFSDLTAANVEDLVAQAEEYFLALTGRHVVPERATHLWGDIAVEIKRNGLPASGQQNVSSIKRGDTTVNYSAGDAGNGLSGLDTRIALFKAAIIR